MKNLRLMARLTGLVKPLAGHMALAVAAGLLGHLSAAFITVLAGFGVLSVLGEVSTPVTTLLWLGVILGVIRGALRYGEQMCNHYIAFKLLAHLRDVMFGALRRLCPAKLAGKNRGDLIASITTDVELLEVFFAHTISPVLIAALFSMLMAAWIGSFHVYQGILALICYMAVGILLPLLTVRAGKTHGEAFRAGAGKLSGFVLDTLRGLGELVQFQAVAQRMHALETHTDHLLATEEKMKAVQGQFSAITGGVLLLCDAAMLGLSVALYQRGVVSFAGLLIPVLALFASFGPVLALAALGSTLQNTLAAGGRVLFILDETPEVMEVSGRPDVVFQGAEASHITFSYDQEQILQDFSVVISPGKTLGIVGKSGSGKSTFLKLLMRFWSVREGAAKISGVSVEEINTANLREMEGFVEQDTHLFHDSIAENLRVAKPDAVQSEMEDACRKAAVHDFIQSLPQGYDTPVGELGDTLSGGERQRIGLARAFLHRAPLLLLDEPTSNLDSLNEGIILHSIQSYAKEHTVVLVSHRASTMGIADEQISVENGRVS